MRTIILFFILFFISIDSFCQDKLSFNNGEFKIAQFTDLHWHEHSSKCLKTEQTIRSVIKKEKPDLAVITGDVIIGDSAFYGWKSIVRIFDDLKMHFVVTMGNHDAEYLSRESIYDILLKSPYYVGEKGPRSINGCGNCIIEIFDGKTNNKVKALLYCIDSNDYPLDRTLGYYDNIHFNQIEWYRRESANYTQNNNGKPLPALAFFHIPLNEYADIMYKKDTYGNHLEETISSSSINSGFYSSVLDMKDIMGIFTGHDHQNDFIGIHNGIALGYGRCTGDEAYGDIERGARIIQLFEGKRKFDTWISTPTTKMPTYFYPLELYSKNIKAYKYMPAKKIDVHKNGVEYSYYEGKCKSVADIPKCKKIESGIMNNFSIKGAPAKDYFAYKYHALINIPQKDIYKFIISSDDGAILKIDDKIVVNNDGSHGIQFSYGIIPLDKGFHDIKLSYFQDYMEQELHIQYVSGYEKVTKIDNNMLFIPE